MAQIVLMIPRRSDFTEQLLRDVASMVGLPAGEPPWVQGECMLDDYRGMILVESVEWATEVESDEPGDGRRTVHAPKIETIKIKRRVDTSSSALTRWVLTTKVSKYPWELYFLRAIGGQTIRSQTQIAGGGFEQRENLGPMQVKFMTMQIFNPLITKYSFSIGDGDAEENLEVSGTKIRWVYHKTNELQRVEGQVAVTYDMQSGRVS